MMIIDPIRSKKYRYSDFEPYPYTLKFRDCLVKRATPAEKRFIRILDDMKIEHIFQHLLNISGRFYVLDFYIPSINVGIEIDGPNHFQKLVAIKDRKREKEIWEYHGIKIYRWSNRIVLKKSRVIFKFIERYFLPQGPTKP